MYTDEVLRVAASIACTALVLTVAAGAAFAQRSKKEAAAEFKAGITAQQEGRLADAKAHYESSLDFVPRATTYFNLATVQEELGETAAAIHSYEQFLSLADDGQRSNVAYANERLAVLRERAAVVLSVASQPPGALVYVGSDHRPVGETPIKLTVVPGAITLRLTHPDRGDTRQVVNVEPGTGQVVHVVLKPLSSRLRVQTNLAGALITIDGVVQEHDRAATFDVAPGRRTISVSKSGYDSYTKTIEATPRASLELDVRLTKNRSTRSKLFIGGLVATATILSAVAVVTGLQASSNDDVSEARVSDFTGLAGLVLGTTGLVYWVVSGDDSSGELTTKQL